LKIKFFQRLLIKYNLYTFFVESNYQDLNMVEARLSRFIEQYKEMLQFQNNITQKYEEQITNWYE